MSVTARRGLSAALALCVVVAAGLAVHALPGSLVTDVAGDALYAVAVFTGLVLVAPRGRPATLATIAASWCVGVELLQLTGLPASWAGAFPPIALVLGLGFDARDLVVYISAVAVAFGVDRVARRRLLPRGERPGSVSASG